MEFCIYNPLWPSPNDPIAVAALFASSNGLHVTLAQLQVIYAKLYNSHKATITALNQRVSEAELRFDSIVKQNGMLIALLGRIRKDTSLIIAASRRGSQVPSTVSRGTNMVDPYRTPSKRATGIKENYTPSLSSRTTEILCEEDLDENSTIKAPSRAQSIVSHRGRQGWEPIKFYSTTGSKENVHYGRKSSAVSNQRGSTNSLPPPRAEPSVYYPEKLSKVQPPRKKQGGQATQKASSNVSVNKAFNSQAPTVIRPHIKPSGKTIPRNDLPAMKGPASRVSSPTDNDFRENKLKNVTQKYPAQQKNPPHSEDVGQKEAVAVPPTHDQCKPTKWQAPSHAGASSALEIAKNAQNLNRVEMDSVNVTQGKPEVLIKIGKALQTDTNEKKPPIDIQKTPAAETKQFSSPNRSSKAAIRERSEESKETKSERTKKSQSMIVPIIEDVGVKGAQPATDMSSSSELPLYSKASAQHEPAVVPVQRSSALNESDCDDELDEFLLNLSGAPDDAMLNKLTKKLMGDKEPSSPAVASVTTTTKTDVVVSLPKPIQVTESIIMKTPGKIIVKPPPTTERGSPKNVPAKLMPRPPTPEWMKAATQNLVRTKKQ